MNGSDLLHQYRRSGSERTFSELVRRFASMVYSFANREVQSSQLAEEVAQTVFTRLAQSPPRNVSSEAELAVWLHRTTLHVAIDTWRSEMRRRTREAKAAAMHMRPDDAAQEWDALAPHLDEAIDQLKSADKRAVLLRFFQQKSLREVGLTLGTTEQAAKMRVGRAVDRLRSVLLSKGITCSAAALGTLLNSRQIRSANAVEVLPWRTAPRA